LVALKLELRVIVSNSTKSLDFIGVFGITLGALALMTTIWFSVLWLTLGVPFAGFGTLMGVILLAFAALFFALRVIAQYLSLIVEKVKSRPSFIVEDSVGYEK
jgi:dolichol-phosphate mannosyltransferase